MSHVLNRHWVSMCTKHYSTHKEKLTVFFLNNTLTQVKNYGRGERVPSAGELYRAIKEKERLLPQSHLFPNPQFRIQNGFCLSCWEFVIEREHEGLCSKVRSRDMGLHCKAKYLGNTFFWKGKNTFHSWEEKWKMKLKKHEGNIYLLDLYSAYL